MPNDLGLVEAMLDPTLTVGECEAAAAKAGRAAARTNETGDENLAVTSPTEPPKVHVKDPGIQVCSDCGD
jgi:hypothetical protein